MKAGPKFFFDAPILRKKCFHKALLYGDNDFFQFLLVIDLCCFICFCYFVIPSSNLFIDDTSKVIPAAMRVMHLQFFF